MHFYLCMHDTCTQCVKHKCIVAHTSIHSFILFFFSFSRSSHVYTFIHKCTHHILKRTVYNWLSKIHILSCLSETTVSLARIAQCNALHYFALHHIASHRITLIFQRTLPLSWKNDTGQVYMFLILDNFSMLLGWESGDLA